MRLVISFFLSVLFLQMNAQVTKTYVQNLPMKGNQIEINLDAPYEIFYCDNSHIKIVTNVTLYNSGYQTLKTLVENDQYLLKLKSSDETVVLLDNSVRDFAKINNKPLRENLSYKIYLPRFMEDRIDAAQILLADVKN